MNGRERRQERKSKIRDAAFRANRAAEQERQNQRREQESADQGQTFTATFTFSDGGSCTQEFRTEEEQQSAQAFFNEGRRRGHW